MERVFFTCSLEIAHLCEEVRRKLWVAAFDVDAVEFNVNDWDNCF
jgi:hypothetical protein